MLPNVFGNRTKGLYRGYIGNYYNGVIMEKKMEATIFSMKTQDIKFGKRHIEKIVNTP